MPRTPKRVAQRPDLEALLTPEQVAEILGVTTGALAQWRYLGTGPRFVKLTGRQIRYAPSDVQNWISEQTKDQT